MWNNLTIKINDRTGYSSDYVSEILTLIEEQARGILERNLPYLDLDNQKSWYVNLETTEC